MADYKRSGGNKGGYQGGGGGRPYGNRPDFNRGGGDRPPQMFSATCAKCGKQTEVPFRPSGNRPVYCKDCFRGIREGESNDPGRRNEGGGQFQASQRDFTPAVRTETQAPDRRIDDLKKQVDAMHSKIDAILRLMKEGPQMAAIAKSAEQKAEQKIESPPAKKNGKKAETKKKPASKKK